MLDDLTTAAKVIRDDIRGCFKTNPDYGSYLATMLENAAAKIEELEGQIDGLMDAQRYVTD